MEEYCGQYVYKECRKNYVAPLGGHAVDGCGEFIPGEHGTSAGSLWCAACGCHRSFHRKVPVVHASSALQEKAAAVQGTRKRQARTTFSEEQKERMRDFAERIGWKMTKGRREEEEETTEFLARTAVSERAFRIWIHNHRHASSTRSAESSSGESQEGAVAAIAAGANNADGNDNV